jgi:hypothetical protein
MACSWLGEDKWFSVPAYHHRTAGYVNMSPLAVAKSHSHLFLLGIAERRFELEEHNVNDSHLAAFLRTVGFYARYGPSSDS